jgi:hypothetical protein
MANSSKNCFLDRIFVKFPEKNKKKIRIKKTRKKRKRKGKGKRKRKGTVSFDQMM